MMSLASLFLLSFAWPFIYNNGIILHMDPISKRSRLSSMKDAGHGRKICMGPNIL